MATEPVVLTIGGQSYRVHTDADPETLARLASQVDHRVALCNPTGRLSPIQALLYAALTLADDLEQQREAHFRMEARARNTLEDVLHRIDAAVTATDRLLTSGPPESDSPTL